MSGSRSVVSVLVATLAVGVVAAAAAPAAAAVVDTFCPDNPPRDRYSSKTAYELVHGEDLTSRDSEGDCGAVYIWHLHRHGTRFPTAKEIKKMTRVLEDMRLELRENLDAGRVQLCPQRFDPLLNFTLSFEPDEDQSLTVQGERDMAGMASRLRQRYPNFFQRHSELSDFTFRSTDTQRTVKSMESFASELFKSTEGLPEPLEEDPLLKFYSLCPAWQDAVKNNDSAKAEVAKFEESEVVDAVSKRVSERLGFEQTLPYDTIDVLSEICRYSQAWDPTTTALWCAAFDEEDTKVFEYRADLKYYYTTAYGNDLNLEVGCPLVKDILDKFTDVVNGSSNSSGNMYFTHSTAIQMTLARLGVAEDLEPLTSDDYEKLKDSRQWQISRLSPFGGNLEVVLYECPNSDDRWQMQSYLNEKPVQIAGCPENSLCSWRTFKSNYLEVAQSCTLDICQKSAATRNAYHSLATLLSLFLILFRIQM